MRKALDNGVIEGSSPVLSLTLVHHTNDFKTTHQLLSILWNWCFMLVGTFETDGCIKELQNAGGTNNESYECNSTNYT